MLDPSVSLSCGFGDSYMKMISGLDSLFHQTHSKAKYAVTWYFPLAK